LAPLRATTMRASLFLMMLLALTVGLCHAMTEKATSSSSVAEGGEGAQSQSERQIEKDKMESTIQALRQEKDKMQSTIQALLQEKDNMQSTIQALRQEKEVEKARNRALEQNRGSEHKADHMGEELKTGAGGVIPGTSMAGTNIDLISVTRSDLCDTYTNSGGTAFCHPMNEADSDCTQSNLTPAGYWDFTDYVTGLVCDADNWEDAISKYTAYQLWKWGHSADFSLKNRTTGFVVISVTGTALGSSVQCELEADVKMMLCNSYASNWTCSCQFNGQAGPLILLEQGAKLISGTQEACGVWFVGASTAVTMLVGNMRSVTLQHNPVTQRCLLGSTCSDTPNWANPHGYGCDAYQSQGWCANGGAAPGKAWTLGASFQYPENNCCVCGKSADSAERARSLGQVQAGTHDAH